MRRSLPAFLLTLTLSLTARTALSGLLTNPDAGTVSGTGTMTDVSMAIQGQSTAGVGTLSLAGGSEIIAASTTNCLTGLTASMVTVLDANPELPGLCYGEDAVNGWLAVSGEPLEFRFEELGFDGLPLSSNIYLDNVAMATIIYPPAYASRPFAVIYDSRVYCGTIVEDDIYLVAVPEPSAGVLLVAGMALVALRKARHTARPSAQ